jgi:hypothetical protein
VARRVGSSNISDTLSTFRDNNMAFFRRSRTVFSVFDLLYFWEKLKASLSSSGTPSRRLEAAEVRAGRCSRSVDSALDVAMTDLCDLEERACRERRVLIDNWARDWGSVVDKADNERVVRWER